MYKLRSYKSQMAVFAGLSFGVALLAGVLGSHVVGARAVFGSPWLVFLLLFGLCVLAIAGTVPWWRKLDDVQKAGQLSAWYWGSQIGGLLVLMALVAATGRKSDYSLGALTLLLGELVGFGIVWLIWRWRSRGPAE